MKTETKYERDLRLLNNAHFELYDYAGTMFKPTQEEYEEFLTRQYKEEDL